MKWYRKLTIDWPCALGDWLWRLLVLMPADFLNRLTFKRVVLAAGLLILVYGFAQIFALDVAIMFAGDTIAYFDIATAVMFFSLRGHAREGLRAAKNFAKAAVMKLIGPALVLVFRKSGRQRRLKNILGRLRGGSKNTDEDPGLNAWGFAGSAA